MTENIIHWLVGNCPVWIALPAVLGLEWMRSAILDAPGWSNCKAASRTNWIRSSLAWMVVVPTAVKLLSGFGPSISFNLSGAVVTVPLELPFSWLAFYFGACCFALSLGLHYLACPKLIRDFDTFSEFSDEGRGSKLLLREAWQVVYPAFIKDGERARFACDVARSNTATIFCEAEGGVPVAFSSLSFDDYEAWQATLHERWASSSSSEQSDDSGLVTTKTRWWYDKLKSLESFSGSLRVKQHKQADAFWSIREGGENVNAYARWTIARLLVVGYVLQGYVAFQGFAYVVSYAWD